MHVLDWHTLITIELHHDESIDMKIKITKDPLTIILWQNRLSYVYLLVKHLK